MTLAKKNETTMSQMTSLQKALKAAAKVRVLVKMATVTAKKAQAPVGSGSSTRPAITVLTSGLVWNQHANIAGVCIQFAWLLWQLCTSLCSGQLHQANFVTA